MKPTDLCAVSTVLPLESTTHTSTLVAVDNSSMDSLDLVLAELQRRADAKTIVLEESLLRAESAQRRFWGINE